MKLGCLFLMCGVWLLCVSAPGELRAQDLEKFRAIVKEEVGASEERLYAQIVASEERLRAETVASEERLRAETVASEKRSKEHTSQEFGKLAVRMDVTDQRRADGFNSVDKNFGYLNTLFAALLAFIAVVIGFPLFRDRKDKREQDAKIEAQQRLIEALQQQLDAVREELASLKQQRQPRQTEPTQS